MAVYVCEEQRKEITNLRDTIDDELNRIAVSDSLDEINVMVECLVKNIQKYASKNSDRVKGVYRPENIKGGDVKFCVVLQDKFGVEHEAELISNPDAPYLEYAYKVVKRKYNPNYGDNRMCKCGHPYHRHFDSYENMEACGCKYCGCNNFVEDTCE